MYKNNQVNSFQPETEHYFEILKYSKIIFYLIEHKIKSYSPLHWSEARLNSIRSNHVLKKFRHCELLATVIFLWCCFFIFVFVIWYFCCIYLLHTGNWRACGSLGNLYGHWTHLKNQMKRLQRYHLQKPCSTWYFYFQSWKQFLTIMLIW